MYYTSSNWLVFPARQCEFSGVKFFFQGFGRPLFKKQGPQLVLQSDMYALASWFGLIMFDLFSRWEDITSNPNTTKANPNTTKVDIPLPCRLHQWVGHSNLVSHHLTACGLNGSAKFSMWDEELWMVENINFYFQHLSRCHQVREIPKVIQTQPQFHHTVNQNHPLEPEKASPISSNLGSPTSSLMVAKDSAAKKSNFTSMFKNSPARGGCMAGAVRGRNWIMFFIMHTVIQ